MQLNPREKLIAMVTLALVILFVGERLVISPALAYRAQLQAEADRLDEARVLDERLVAGLPAMEARWANLRESGLTNAAGDAESHLLQAVREWANEAGVSVTSLVPDRVEPDDRLPRVYVRVAGTGAMREIVALLERLQTAELPVRIREMQISPRRDNSNEMTLQLRLSTLYVSDQPTVDPRMRRARP